MTAVCNTARPRAVWCADDGAHYTEGEGYTGISGQGLISLLDEIKRQLWVGEPAGSTAQAG